MNKYKMIAICSLSIVCILILSLLLPLTTSANDKESIELKMHYENSKVTVNIVVNSEVYTGVVCKYIEVDNVLTADNLSEQTQKTGTTLNLNKTENDNYNTTIENVSKRYVVIYVSIGNCDICDYIDCNLNSSEETHNKDSEESNQEVEEKDTNNQNTENQNTETEENTQNQNTETEKNDMDNKNQNTQNNEDNEIENEDNNETNSQNNANNNNDNSNKSEENKIVVENNNAVENTEEFQTIDEDITTTKTEQSTQTIDTPEKDKNENKENESQTTNQKETQVQAQTQTQSSIIQSDENKKQTTNKPASQINLQKSDKDTINIADDNAINNNKDNINTDGFEEIKSVDKTISTADTKMPQTGENDSIKIIGIVIFSIISVLSFYKYKKTK